MVAKKNQDSWKPGTPIEQNSYYWNGEPFIKCASEESTPTLGKFTVVDLFCGCGGFSTGIEAANFLTLASSDIHPPSVDTLLHNHPSASVIVGDMRRVDEKMILDAVANQRVDVVAAGVPCQGFSLNNRKRHDQDDRNFLFWEFIRVVQILKPRIVILENVSGLASSANGAFKTAISGAIKECGYQVDSSMLNALEFGVPQKRRRLFFIGALPDIELRWPRPAYGPGRLLPIRTVWDAIGDLPQIGPGECADAYDQNPFTEYQREMRGKCKKLYNHEAPNHPQETIDKIGNTKPGKPIYPLFPQRIRLSPSDPSPTQVSGGIRPQFQFGHPTLPRGLTVRERCRLQSFPDSYYICGGVVQGRVQTGNAVPPLLAKAIAVQVRDMLQGKPPSNESIPAGLTQMVLF